MRMWKWMMLLVVLGLVLVWLGRFRIQNNLTDYKVGLKWQNRFITEKLLGWRGKVFYQIDLLAKPQSEFNQMFRDKQGNVLATYYCLSNQRIQMNIGIYLSEKITDVKKAEELVNRAVVDCLYQSTVAGNGQYEPKKQADWQRWVEGILSFSLKNK